jgi:hypothetical protein
MTPLYKKILLILLLVIGVVGVIKTNHVQRLSGTGDLRNRVVGARLMKDGILPYYYHWQPGDSLRYVIERVVDTSHRRRVNNVTAPPSFHRLIMPFADHTESDIERGFFLLFYGMLAAIAILTWYQSKNLLLTLLFFVPFLFTDAWWHHISLAQYYFLFGFLFFVTSYLLWKKHWIWAGIVFTLLVILRLNTVVFILPFLIYFGKFKRFILSTAIAIGLFAAIVYCLPFERANWTEYFGSLEESTAIHLLKKPGEHRTYKIDLPAFWEGENYVALQKKGIEEHIWVNPEMTSIVPAFRKLFGWAPSLKLLQALLLAAILVVSMFLIRRKNPLKQPVLVAPEPIILSGLLFYFLSNFFSPINIPPYQMPQWMAVAGLLIMFRSKLPQWILILFLMGILCNCRYVPNLPGKHMLSEIIFLVSTFSAIILGKWYEPGAEGNAAMNDKQRPI